MNIAEYARRAEGFVGINGRNVWGDIKKYTEKIEYTDVASGETDSFDITLQDRDERFINDWLIEKGTPVDSKIRLNNWNTAGDENYIECGEFIVDEIQVNGQRETVAVKSLALPLIGEKNTKKWENITISAIAEDICKWIGVELEYYAEDITLKSRQQSRQTDIDFLYSTCKEYGLGMKVYRNKIVIFDREAQDAAKSVMSLNLKKIVEDKKYTIRDSLDGTYTGAKCTYKNEGSDTEYTYNYGSSERVINLDTSASSAREAELKCRAAVYDANIAAIKLTFTALGLVPSIYTGCNYYFYGIGGYSGKYAVDKVKHSLSGDSAYRIQVEAHAVALEKDRPKETENTSANTTSSITAGATIELLEAPLYISSDASSCVRKISGRYYLYDGKDFNGRYRICFENEVGKTPVGEYVIGYVAAADIK